MPPDLVVTSDGVPGPELPDHPAPSGPPTARVDPCGPGRPDRAPGGHPPRHDRSHEPRDGADPLPDTFWSVARRLRETFRETTAPWDITPAQARALMVLLRRGSIRLGDLSTDLRIAPRSATEVVDALAGRGLVERTPDPSDRRAVLVSVTEAGLAAGADIRRARTGEADRFFGVLAESDRAELHRLLRMLLP